ncbi:MAG: right-handed parallel beta-helix repeat-containing protein [Vicinamibacterales bacterium]
MPWRPAVAIARRIGTACGVAACLAACGGSPPASPVAPAPALALAVTGAREVGIGQTAQLTARLSSGEDVTRRVSWETTDRNVATVDNAGVFLGRRAGTVDVIATYSASTSARLTASVTVVRLSSPAIATCGAIVAPGSYVLAADVAIAVPSGPCLTIEASGVRLDCADHTVTGIHMTDVSDVVVTGCTLVSESIGSGQSFALATRSSNVTFVANRLLSIVLRDGQDNRVLQNVIDGGYPGSGPIIGQDDGVLLVNEAHDTIQGNTIRNVWDAGIEGVDVVRDSLIADNTIDNAVVAGVSSYWCTHWTGNTIRDNRVSRSYAVVRFRYQVGADKCQNVDTPGAFSANRMVGNTLRDDLGDTEGSMYFKFPSLDPAVVFDNLLQGNDLGRSIGPYVVPASGFIDGGGNVCGGVFNPFCGG